MIDMENRGSYEVYFGLSATPFGRDIPVKELMKNEQWNELACRLVQVAKNNLFGLFTGETGTGKTTALRRMAAELDKNRYRILYVYDSDLTPRNFYVETLHQLGYKAKFYRGDAKRQLTKALNEIAQTSQISVIVVDEAHLLSHEMLEEIRFLLNLEMDSKSSCSLILAGQSELRSKLKLQIHQAIDGRVDMRFHLEMMSVEETAKYVKRHLERVNCPREIFTESALKVIHDYSGGIARKVNKVSEMSLMAAASQKKQLIDDYLVKEVIMSELEV
jgi:type II secretory pathway predicted ATPase ExeA